MSPMRSILAVLTGVVLVIFVRSVLEQTLVGALADAPLDESVYLAIRNRPLVLAATLVGHALAATLAGYIVARIAGEREVQHALIAAAVLVAAYAFAFTADNPMLPPTWARIVILLITAPALAAGAAVRAQVRALHAEGAGPSRPEERS